MLFSRLSAREEATNPWQGDSGPWRGTYFTATEGSLRAPFIVRWPGKIPAGRVSNEIVHIVDMLPTLARVGGAPVPNDRPIDGVDQLGFFEGKQEQSNREGFPAYVADRLSAVKWRNWKMHFIWQENMYDAPITLAEPKVINLLTDLKEARRCRQGRVGGDAHDEDLDGLGSEREEVPANQNGDARSLQAVALGLQPNGSPSNVRFASKSGVAVGRSSPH